MHFRDYEIEDGEIREEDYEMEDEESMESIHS